MSRDPADYRESQAAPDLPADSLEDCLAELVGRDKVPAVLEVLQTFAQAPARQKPEPLALQVMFERLAPSRAELINRWAFSIALGAKESQRISAADIAAILDVSRESVSKRVREWRAILHLPKPRRHSEAIQNGHRTRKRHGYVYKTPTGGRSVPPR